jgi:hypothetical protein
VYEPNRTSFYDLTNDWKLLERDEHNLGVVPIVPMVNRSRLADWRWPLRARPILPLARAANKLATDMMVAAEFIAVPLRGIFGVEPGRLRGRRTATNISADAGLMGRLLTVPDDEKVTPSSSSSPGRSCRTSTSRSTSWPASSLPCPACRRISWAWPRTTRRRRTRSARARPGW